MSVHSVGLYQKILPTETFSSLKIFPKCVCGRGSTADPAGGAHSARPLARLREGRGEKEGEGGNGGREEPQTKSLAMALDGEKGEGKEGGDGGKEGLCSSSKNSLKYALHRNIPVL